MLAVCLVTGALTPASLAGSDPDPTGSPTETASSDSLELYDEILSRGAAADEADAAALAGELSAGVSNYRSAGGSKHRFYLRAERVTGYRVAEWLETGWRGGSAAVRLSARRDRGRHGGFVELRGWGPLTRLVAGGIRPRFGEGLLLGVRYLPFASPRPAGAGPSDDGPAATSSIWGRKLGAAVTVGAGSLQATVAGWRETDNSNAWWSWVSRTTRSGTVGVAAGTRRTGDTVGLGRLDAAVFVERSMRDITLAGELASFRGRVFSALHAVVRSGGVWNAVLFEAPAPRGFSGGVVAPGDEYRGQSGGAVHRTGRWRGVATRISLYGNVKRTAQSVLGRRRLDASVRGRAGGGGSWSVSVRVAEESESEFPEEAIEHRTRDSRRREAHIRCGWTDAARGPFRQRYRVTARMDDRGATGLVGTVGWTLAYSIVEAGCQVSNYAMASGQTGYVMQSGLPGSEAVSAVSRNGSDLSARLRLRIRGLSAQLYWSRAWGRPGRWYAIARLSL
jgi:hypothetical protein